VSPKEENGNINVFVVSDRLQPLSAQLNVSLLDFDGNKLLSQQKDIEVAALSSKSYFTIPVDKLLAERDASRVFLLTEVIVDGKVVSSNQKFFRAYKDLKLPPAQITTEVLPVR